MAYFSRTGTTRVIAGQIARSLDAHLFEIEPTESYPADYFAMVEQATRERDTGFAPAIMGMVPKLASYETIFLDFPVWGETVPSPIRSFLSSHDLTGKRLIPVITHGGYGVGNSLEFLREAAPNARILEGFPFEGPQERQAVTRVMEWLPVAASQLQY